MKYSELGGTWQVLPSWLNFLLQLGFKLQTNPDNVRQITVVSMPCDSNAAGIIALGALIGSLTHSGSSDEVSHHSSMLRYAEQYLTSCRTCANRCIPHVKRCGYLREATGTVRNTDTKRRKYLISLASDVAKRLLAFEHDGCTSKTDNASVIANYYIDGDPPLNELKGKHSLASNFYESFLDGIKILQGRLETSYSGLCYSGRSAGGRQTRDSLAQTSFEVEGMTCSLLELLTLDEVSNTVSRMNFFNARTKQFNRHSAITTFAVADGGKSFLETLSNSAFQHANLVGIVDRSRCRDELEDVGARIADLRQWYSPLEARELLPTGVSVPVGINVAGFIRK